MNDDRWWRWSSALAVTMLLWSVAYGVEDGDLAGEIAELRDRLNRLEARQERDGASLSEEIDRSAVPQAEEESDEPAEILKWASKLRWFGDFRYRYEYIDEREDSVRNRNRIRARLGLKVEVNDEWDLGFRLATSSGDPVSTNVTFDEFFSDPEFRLDRAFAGYHPDWMEGLDAFLGKVANPFYKPGKNELIWDSDLTPEGGAVLYGMPLRDGTVLNWVAGGFWVNEESGEADTSLWGIQAYVKHQLDKRAYLRGAASLYCYGNIQGAEGPAAEWDNDPGEFFGNTRIDADPDPVETDFVFASDYDLFELFLELGTEVAEMPVLAFGDWVRNTVAVDDDEDTGWIVGAQLNKAKEPGSWQFAYDYRDLERDAVVGQFSSSDFLGGGTGGQGHRFALAYMLARNVAASVTYYDNEFHGRNDNVDYDRVQVDLGLKF